MLTKVSILCFYLRIFREPKFKIAVYLVSSVCCLYLVAFLPPTILQCRPISFIWTVWTRGTEGRCLNIFTLAWITSIINILLDLTVIALPIPFLLRLTLSRRKKIQVIAMFSVGLL